VGSWVQFKKPFYRGSLGLQQLFIINEEQSLIAVQQPFNCGKAIWKPPNPVSSTHQEEWKSHSFKEILFYTKCLKNPAKEVTYKPDTHIQNEQKSATTIAEF